MAVDPQYGNSSGYFRDPTNGEDLSVDTPRAVPCSFENGKFTWPMVLTSDGEQLIKIVYKLFTDEEKDLYKAYRGRSGSSSGHSQVRTKREPKPKAEPKSEEPIQVIKHDPDSAVTLKTLETLAQCDRLYGISQIAGITYVLCGSYGSSAVHHIPRALVPDEEFDRLCGGTA